MEEREARLNAAVAARDRQMTDAFLASPEAERELALALVNSDPLQDDENGPVARWDDISEWTREGYLNNARRILAAWREGRKP
jgi:hypothetical protein